MRQVVCTLIAVFLILAAVAAFNAHLWLNVAIELPGAAAWLYLGWRKN